MVARLEPSGNRHHHNSFHHRHNGQQSNLEFVRSYCFMYACVYIALMFSSASLPSPLQFDSCLAVVKHHLVYFI